MFAFENIVTKPFHGAEGFKVIITDNSKHQRL